MKTRCSKCILPESIPGIHFDRNGVCNYCHNNFPNYSPKGEEELLKFITNQIKQKSTADCLVGLSGGKDSTFTLYTLKERFGLKVEAFTYIHEGSTDFSVKNAINVCKSLGVKHHIVSLKKEKHLRTFKGFFTAFTKKPSSTIAGMTCVACKHLHIFGMKIAKERGIPIVVWSNSPLEYPPFLALKYKADSTNQFQRESVVKGAVLLLYELSRTIDFPITFLKYFDVTLPGCLAAFPTSKYLRYRYPSVVPLFFYDYIKWEPRKIKQIIQEKVHWENPTIGEDWHSDCLFNYFKEYMFLKMFGASYTDAYLSNQIRYNLLTREEALTELKLSRENNLKGILYAIEKLNLNSLKNKIDYKVFMIENENTGS